MAQAPYFLRKLQLGRESTAGTAVPATFKLVGEGKMTPMIEREFEEFPRGIRAPVTDAGFAISRSTEVEFESNLTYEEVIPFLDSGLCTAVLTGAGPYTYTFDPVLTAAQAIKTYTAEMRITDGTTHHYEREAAYMFTQEMEVELKANEPAVIKVKMAGRAEQTSTVTADLPVITGRAQIPSNLFKVFINDTGGAIGTTQVSGLVRAATLSIDFGNESDFTLDGRASLDMTGIQPQTLTGTLDLTMEHNAAAATEVGKWRGTEADGHGAARFIRLKADNGAAAGANKAITFDGCWVYTDPPDFSEDDGTELITMKMALEYDSTWAKAFMAIVINGLTAVP